MPGVAEMRNLPVTVARPFYPNQDARPSEVTCDPWKSSSSTSR